ncbi:MAG: anion permease [Coriobacteriaceae bacterium]|jgi:sodium-dependent dicarboxylate transporter 2/3/5|nr:anion permease [Coriobacteriaceae bacterium]
MVKKIIGLILAVVVLAGTMLLDVPQGLTREGFMAIGVLAFALILWICETFPMAGTAILILAVVPTIGLLPYGEALSAFGSPPLFFVIASTSITVIMMKTSIPLKAVSHIVRITKGNPRQFLFGFMLVEALFSSFMSNIPVTILFMGLVASLLKKMNAERGKSNLGKCLYFTAGFAAMIGGAMTPIGSSINIMAMGILESAFGITITFVQWMVVCIPIALFILVAAWFSLIAVFKPERIPESALGEIQIELSQAKGFNRYEGKVLVMVVAMFVFWFLGSFYPVINATTVGIFGMAVMLLPFTKMMTWQEFQKEVSWTVVMVFGGVSVMAAPFVSTGAAAWMTDAFVAATSGMGPVEMAMALTAFFVVVNIFFPMGPAVIGLLCAPMAGIALAGGVVSPGFTTIALTIASSVNFLIPISMIYLLVLEAKWFQFNDCLKAGIIPTVAVWLGTAFIAPPLCMLMGVW